MVAVLLRGEEGRRWLRTNRMRDPNEGSRSLVGMVQIKKIVGIKPYY